jgi:RNA-binding protein YhbY
MAVEKGLYSAPLGIEEESLEQETNLEIEIVNPEMVTLDDGSVEVTIIPDADISDVVSFDANLAEVLDDSVLNELSDELIGSVDSDTSSRKDWADTFVKGLDVLGFNYEERNEPWEGACGVYSTVLAEAAIRFQAETMSETFPAAGPVKVKVLGEETKDKEEAAQRVKADMNYELTERMVEYRPEHERLLYSLGLAGSAFKKVYYDTNIGRQVAMYIPAEDVIVSFGS